MKKLVISIFATIILFLMTSVSVMAVTQEQITSQRAQVEELTKEIAELDNQINTAETQLQSKNAEVEQTTQELLKTQQEEADLKEASKERIRAAYIYGTEGCLDLLFSAENPSDFISYYDVAKDILKADKNSLEELKKKREEIQELQKKLEEERNNLVTAKREAEATRSIKQTLLSTNQELVTQLENLLRVQNTTNSELPNTVDTTPRVTVDEDTANNVQIQESSPQLIQSPTETEDQTPNNQAVEEIVQSSSAMVLPNYAAQVDGDDRIEEPVQNGNPYALEIPSTEGETVTIAAQEMPSSWIWPLDTNANNAFTITSLMGTRESPGGIGSTNHQGTDIGADYGSAVLAAQSGKVTVAGSYGGYGNAIVIKHDNGYTTIYGHLSSVAVDVGEQVQAGQIIGFVGSTGWSTGPHLHFEVHFTDNTGKDTVLNGLSLYGQDIYDKLNYQ